MVDLTEKGKDKEISTNSLEKKMPLLVECCTAPEALLQPFPILAQATISKQPCCTSKKIRSSGTKHHFMGALSYWLMGGFIVLGISLVIFKTGVALGDLPDVLWPEILEHLLFVGKAVRSILPFFVSSYF